LDQGLEATTEFFLPFFKKINTDLLTKDFLKDYKTALQEQLQQKKCDLPKYSVLKEEGPDHDKLFLIEVEFVYQTKVVKTFGQGPSKKEAEQSAAKYAIYHLNQMDKK